MTKNMRLWQDLSIMSELIKSQALQQCNFRRVSGKEKWQALKKGPVFDGLENFEKVDLVLCSIKFNGTLVHINTICTIILWIPCFPFQYWPPLHISRAIFGAPSILVDYCTKQVKFHPPKYEGISNKSSLYYYWHSFCISSRAATNLEHYLMRNTMWTLSAHPKDTEQV